MAASLAPLLALAGHCFAGQLAPGTVDRHCFSAVFDGRHVRDIHAVTKDGRTVYQGETLYSVEGDAVNFTYWTSMGGIGRGTASFAAREWRFTLTMRATPANAPKPFASRWRWQGPATFTVSGGTPPVTYRRTR